ncbi:MAG: 50S ribosomal protein L2 [Candidatus Riflebacteria bacterium RBG_13_59_9]|nr:MAG: 50S ribosomal protein L2 [Candidatus Riflebacteria bacterium RBG_13_59_9]
MALKKYRPYTPSRRGMQTADYSTLTGGPVPTQLTEAKHRSGGRNSQGRTTVRFRGGGNRQRYRKIDFHRREEGEAEVIAVQYDPNRSAFIALVRYRAGGTLSYILAPDGVKVGSIVQSGERAPIRSGNALPLKSIPDGTLVHNIELRAGSKGKLARSGGTYAQVMAKEGRRCILRLPSGEMRYVPVNAFATIGRVSNVEHENVKLGKAGRQRNLGRRPHPRGVHMNPVDHPLGGGEGKSKSGRPPCSPTGVIAKGFRTRSRGKSKIHLVKDRRAK